VTLSIKIVGEPTSANRRITASFALPLSYRGVFSVTLSIKIVGEPTSANRRITASFTLPLSYRGVFLFLRL